MRLVGEWLALKGMNILMQDNKIINRYVYYRKSGSHHGLIRIGKGYQLVVKSSDPITHQWVAVPWNETGDAMLADYQENVEE